MIGEGIQEGCVDILAQEDRQCPEDVIVRNVFRVPSLSQVVVDFLQDVVDYGYVEGKEEVGVVLEPKDQVPPLAVPLAILK